MGENNKITQEMMKNADSYIPLSLKKVIADTMAQECVKPAATVRPYGEEEETQENPYGVPPVWCESPESKALVMMAVLCVYYLHIWDEEHALVCTPDEYDQWAGAHIINQIERYKAGEYREKAFDLLADLREMEKMLNSAVYSVLREKNDPVARFIEAMAYMGSTEGIQAALDIIRESKDGIEQEREMQDAIVQGAEAGEETGEENAAGN